MKSFFTVHTVYLSQFRMLDKSEFSGLNYRLKKGEAEAFHLIYRKYFENLCAYAMRYVYDIEIAKDIVQDAYMALWNNLSKYNPDQDILPYLISVVRNKSVNYLKRIKVRDSHKDKIIEALLFANIEDSDLDEGVRERLHSLLELLPKKSYQILIERIVENKKISAIAMNMNIAESTVKTHLKRSMKILRKNLLLILIGI